MINDPMTVNLDVVYEFMLDSIMLQIGEMSYPEDADMIRGHSKQLLKQGWLPSEIVPYQRCSEHVDKTLEEDVALGRMAHIERRVLDRLGIKEFPFLVG